jgi:hypothetical protein
MRYTPSMSATIRSAAITRPSGSASFAVDNVQPSVRPIWSETLAENLARRLDRRVLILPDSDKHVINPVVDSRLGIKASKGRKDVSECHPLIEAVHTAFGQHYPLTLSPDSIWLALAQGFSHHIAKCAGESEQRLIRHTQRRRTLLQEIEGLTLLDFESAIAGFSAQIRSASDPVVHETLVCDFSTTTPTIRTASEVVLMDTYSSYFDYAMRCVCGIPKITVTGSVDDWNRIRARIEVLAAYGLEWWVSRLRPIVDEFIWTVKGSPNPEFWQAIYKPEVAYGPTRVTGWIADLFPYLVDRDCESDGMRTPNHVFQYQRIGWAIPSDKGVRTDVIGNPSVGVPENDFPSGLSKVPVKLLLPFGSRRNVDLVGGYLAVEQSPADLSVQPVLSWFLADSEPLPRAELT